MKLLRDPSLASNCSTPVQRIVILSTLLFSTSGCHFKSPSLAEQRALAAKGALAANSTDWAAVPLPRGQQFNDGFQAGIPDYTRASAPIDALAYRSLPEPVAQQQESPSDVRQPQTVPDQQTESPLDRIARSCPGSEAEVNDALKTAERAQQIKKYEALTRRCPASSDLWVWLGLDYYRSGRLDDAKHALQQAVLLNPSDQEAKGYLSEVQRKLAEAMRPGAAK